MAGSITLALNTARSGLLASQQALDATANNIANVNTDGYSRKVVQFENRSVDGTGAGVRVAELARYVDENLLKNLRGQTSGLSEAQARGDTFERLQELFGKPGDNTSVAHTLSEFRSSVEQLSLQPDQVLNQREMVRWAEDAAHRFKTMSDTIQDLRKQADADIADSVEEINELTEHITDLNNKIIRNDAIGKDVSDLQDERDRALTSMSELTDISYYSRDDGDVVVFTKSGLSLVDNTARQLEFSPASATDAATTKAEGDLSDIVLQGTSEDVTDRFGSGKLSGLVALRDRDLPNLQGQLDELAGKMKETMNRFQNRGAAFPGGQSFEGSRRLMAPSQQTITLGGTSDVRFTLADDNGKQQATTTLETIMTSSKYGASARDSRGPWSLSEVGDAMQDWLQDKGAGNAKVDLSQGYFNVQVNDNALNLSIRDEAEVATPGAAAQDATIKFDADGDGSVDTTEQGFSHFLGLNDFYSTGLADNIHDSEVKDKGFTWNSGVRRLYFSESEAIGGGLSGPTTPEGGLGYADIPEGATLKEMADAINASQTLEGVSASVVPDGAGERLRIQQQCTSPGQSIEHALQEASGVLSSMSHGAGLVFAPKSESALKHIELVPLGRDRALVVLVTEQGMVENRVVEMPAGTPPSVLEEATNYLNARIRGRTLGEAREAIQTELERDRAQLDDLASRMVEAGLATWSGSGMEGSLIVRGQANLLEDITALDDLERIRGLFEALETKETLLRFVDLTSGAEGVQIFIGADNQLFNMAGVSMVVAPFHASGQNIVGAIGVIGPTHINYARIIPVVDYTSKVIGSLLGSSLSETETGS